MKKLLPIFGILDIITLIRSYEHLIPGSTSWAEYPLITIASSVLYASLIFSAYFLIRKQKAGLWLTYFQFPLRMAFLVLSFGFVLMAARLFNDRSSIYNILMWFVIGLEIARLITTIIIYKESPTLKRSVIILTTIGILLFIFQVFGGISLINNCKPGYPCKNNWVTFLILNFIPLIVSLVLFAIVYMQTKKSKRS